MLQEEKSRKYLGVKHDAIFFMNDSYKILEIYDEYEI